VMFAGKPIGWAVVCVALALLAGAVVFSKRGSVNVGAEDEVPTSLHGYTAPAEAGGADDEAVSKPNH